jgi:ParB family transcriptional regulator, chromosome partitioning protein
MQLEFHQLDRRWEHLRVRHPARQRRLLASLADSGQQSPIVVVAAEGQTNRYVVIDGYKRIEALEQLGRDTVEAVVWPMSEAAAVLLDRSLRFSEHESALEQGWLLAELEQRFGYGLDELARRFDRSVSWVSRRLALVEALPETIQPAGARGKDSGAGGHEVSGAGGAPMPGRLPADGRDIRPASLRYPRSWPTVCRLAQRLAHGPQTHPG